MGRSWTARVTKLRNFGGDPNAESNGTPIEFLARFGAVLSVIDEYRHRQQCMAMHGNAWDTHTNAWDTHAVLVEI